MAGQSRVLAVATCQFAESFQPERNAVIIRRYIAAAARRGAEIVHFHECALSGYGGPVGSDGYDWDTLRKATESVLREAARHRIWVVLGTSHRLTRPHKPLNSLYLISPAGAIVGRYDKRFCTTKDLETYSPGDHDVVFDLNGIRCGLLICYDVRFPELYRNLCREKVRVVFHSFHNAGADGPGILTHIIRRTLQAHAGINSMWISAPNSSKRYSLWPGTFITPDGLVAGRLAGNRSGMMINTVDTAKDYYDSSRPFRDAAMRGVLHSGRIVKDPRSSDQTCY